MAQACGTRAKQRPTTDNNRTGRRVVRLLGFCTLAGMGLALLASVVLLPAYSRYCDLKAQHVVEVQALADARATVAAYDRLIDRIPYDDVLARRLAASRLGMMPRKSVVVSDPVGRVPSAPDIVTPVKTPLPAAKASYFQGLALRMEKPGVRRGLLLVATALFALAIILCGPKHSRAYSRAEFRAPWLHQKLSRRNKK